MITINMNLRLFQRYYTYFSFKDNLYIKDKPCDDLALIEGVCLYKQKLFLNRHKMKILVNKENFSSKRCLLPNI